jgi:ferredoxin
MMIFFTIVKIMQDHYKEKDGGNPYKIVLRTFKGMLMFFFVGVAVGVGFVVSLVEPYSIFGRVMHEGLRPLVQGANNFLAAFFGDSFGREVISVSWLSAVVALVTIGIIGLLAWIGGRRYCNSFCPIGTLLGEVSRASLFKIQIDTSKCIDCGLCGRKCKGECIDTANHRVDATRCVVCFDCIDACSQGAISFTMRSKTSKEKPADNSRREFLATVAAVAAIPVAEAQQRHKRMEQAMQGEGGKHRGPRPVAPPGAQSIEHLQAKCTACHLCISKCPSHVLQPAVMEYGLQGIMQPVM